MIRLPLTDLPDRLSSPAFRRWLQLPILSFCLLFLLCACGTPPRPTNDAGPEEMENFRAEMAHDAVKAGDYLKKTQGGTNISEMTLGWFIYDVLTELSSQDVELYDYFNKDNASVEGYLKTRFKTHPVEEIAAIDSLAKRGHPTLRLSARYALEALRHIPDSGEPSDIQERDRRELAAALSTLQDLLQKSSRDVGSSRP
ncbi:hypothetical protein [Telmatospirillum siberiense]|nr:hypothetical protein [Telmatospirillum siberiense]